MFSLKQTKIIKGGIIINIKYFKSPMNYVGNKYKLLNQILPLFPLDIDNFYDVFCGGLDISLNLKANNIFSNDINAGLIWLYDNIKLIQTDKLGEELHEMDKLVFPMNYHKGKALNSYRREGDKETWEILMGLKRKVYYELRDKFNSGEHDIMILLLLMYNGYCEYDMSEMNIKFACGNNRLHKKLINPINDFKNKLNDITVTNNDFRLIREMSFNKKDFVYLDPPYLNTRQYANKWYKKDEQELYQSLDYLHEKGIKFALSNFADGKTHTNEYLLKWCGKYNVHNLSDDHYKINNWNSKLQDMKRQEILVTNY